MSAEEISIRPAIEADRPALIALTVELQAYEQVFEANRSSPAAMAAPYVEEIWSWARERSGALLVAETGGDENGAGPNRGGVIGYACCGLGSGGIDDLPEYEKIGRITDLVVSDGRRGVGVGARLIRAAEAQMKSAGALRIEIAALVGNAAAQAAYRACGYRPCYTVFERYLGGPLAKDGDARDAST